MANHDYIISNQTFPSTRTDINSALQAIVSNNSSATEPSTKYAYMMWYDTTTDSWKMRNADNDDWIQLATFDQATNTVNFLDSTISSPLSVTGTSTAGAEIRLPEDTDNGSSYVALKSPDALSANITFTLPSAYGTTDQFLKTDGSGNLSFTDVSGVTSWQSVQTTGFTAVAGNGYPCNTTAAAFTVTLPASANAGDTIVLVDYAGTFNTNNLILERNGLNIEGATFNKLLTTNREAVTCTYVDATQGWVASSGVNSGDQALDPTFYSADFLVVAGGGSGGGLAGGGGGAGGYRTSTQNINIGTSYTITVGDGGAARAASSGANGSAGSNSSISGSGLTTITSAGGGYGTAYNGSAGGDGGSGGAGGGGAGTISGGSGNTPSTSPSQGNNGGSGVFDTGGANARNGGGGGGSGAVGGNANGSTGTNGNGGNGTASSITGSSVTYAGGGGGSENGSSTAGTGGTGGGGAGAVSPDNGNAGTVNTGGGGGGASEDNTASGAGGKGIVILSVPTAKYSGTTTGSPTVATSGLNTILSFTGTGSYTA